MTAPAVRVADVAAKTLCDLGVRRVYGLPGEDHMELLDAMSKAGIDYVFARNETSACIMACVDADATGRPAVVIVSMAPGLTNAINGIANAYLDHLPLIVISGQHDRARLPLTIRQVIDSHEIVRGSTKWRASSGNAVRQLLVKAFDVATTAPQGPVYLEIASEMAAAAAPEEANWMPPERPAVAFTQQRSDGAIGRWQQALVTARHPIVVVGHGARGRSVAPALRELALALRIPVFTTPSAKGLLPADDPWAAGTFVGGNLEGKLLMQSDLLVAIGLNGNDFLNRAWPYRAPILAIGPQALAEGMLPMSAELVGDVPSTIAGFLAAAAESHGMSEWTADDIRTYRASVDAELAGPDRLTVPSALRAIRGLFPRDTLVAVDAGFAKPFTALLWKSYVPQSYFSSHGLSTMGYALPAANALKLLYPERQVVGFMGDGSMLMRASEIGVAAQLDLAPIYVVWMDNSMTQIAVKQARRGLRTVGVDLAPVSCASIAAAFGGVGHDVHSHEELISAVGAALKETRPSLIGVHVDTSAARDLFDLVRG